MPTHPETVDTGTRLAVDRTRLAHERTLMAWVRTAVSMISFGFTVYKFFQFDMANRPAAAGIVLGPREFALIMIGIGLAALLLSTAQHVRNLRQLRAEFGSLIPPSVAAPVALLFSVLGVLAFLAVVLRR